jgi:K+-transporting ATPase A subunit
VTATTIYAEPTIDAGVLTQERPNSFLVSFSPEMLDILNNKETACAVNIQSAITGNKKIIEEDASSVENNKKVLSSGVNQVEMDAKKSFFGRAVSSLWNVVTAVTAAASAAAKNVWFAFGRA